MGGWIWSDNDYGFLIFIGITLILGGAGAFATGRALAKTWRPMQLLLVYMLLLTAGVRFLHFALYQEPLLDPVLFVGAYVWTLIVSVIGYKGMRARQMATQYSWAYERRGLAARLRAPA